MEISFSNTLEDILILNIDPDVKVDLGITEVSDNLYQITKYPDDVHFSIESTGNWNLSISAANKYFICSDDSTCKVPVDFVSYYIENKGTNWDNGLFSNIANRTKDTALSLSNKKTMVLVNGKKNNIGGAEENAFVLRWELGFMNDQITEVQMVEKALIPFKEFMLQQTRESDIELFAGMAKIDSIARPEDTPFSILLPAFVTSELKTAFQIGFLIFIPFIVIDLTVASVLMSMGMMMLSPMIISLPFKLMLFVLVDGWALVMGTLAASFFVA